MNLGLHYKNQDHIFDEKEVNGVPFLSYPMLEETGIVNHGFSTRLGGVSKGCWATMNISTTRGDDPEDVRENQRRIAGAIGVQPEDMTFTNQTHTTNVAVVKAGDRGKRFQKTYGSDPEDIIAAIGPSICRDCYEVSGDVIQQFRENFDEAYWPELFYKKENGKYQLDLWRANERIFTEAGIREDHIAVTNVCTHCNPDILFSHRTTGDKRGNVSAFLALKQMTTRGV